MYLFIFILFFCCFVYFIAFPFTYKLTMTDIEVINALVDVNDKGNWFCSDGVMDYHDSYVDKSLR